MRKSKPKAISPAQALGMVMPLLDGSTGKMRRNSLGVFRLRDFMATLDAAANRFTQDHQFLTQLSDTFGGDRLIAECELSDSELTRLVDFTLYAGLAGRPSLAVVRTPEENAR